MKIGGRVIQERNIKLNNESSFKAFYKSHLIAVDLIKLGHTNTYDVFVRTRHTSKKSVKLDDQTRRCTIREAIIYALDKAGL